MSRAHMLYGNPDVKAIPMKVTTWSGAWNPDNTFKLTSGRGIIADGIILAKSRHLIVDGVQSSKKIHYLILHISISKAFQRKYDSAGYEIEPDFGSKKKVNTGYLMSSFKTISKEGEDALSFEKVKTSVKVADLERLTVEKENELRQPNIISFWCAEKDFENIDLPFGANVRFRTRGNGPFLESITCLNAENTNLANYTTGEPVGGSWTDKIMASKEESGDVKQQEGDGADDDEWDD